MPITTPVPVLRARAGGARHPRRSTSSTWPSTVTESPACTTTMSPGPTPADPSDQNVKVRPSRDAATTSDTAVMARSSRRARAGAGRRGIVPLPIMADAVHGTMTEAPVRAR